VPQSLTTPLFRACREIPGAPWINSIAAGEASNFNSTSTLAAGRGRERGEISGRDSDAGCFSMELRHCEKSVKLSTGSQELLARRVARCVTPRAVRALLLSGSVNLIARWPTCP